VNKMLIVISAIQQNVFRVRTYGFSVPVVFVEYVLNDSYLVDPASSHMLVSKIKPCMSKYKQFCTVKLRMAH
jgi:hypothetical protein